MPITHVFIGHLPRTRYAVDTLAYSVPRGAHRTFFPARGGSKRVNKYKNEIILESDEC